MGIDPVTHKPLQKETQVVNISSSAENHFPQLKSSEENTSPTPSELFNYFPDVLLPLIMLASFFARLFKMTNFAAKHSIMTPEMVENFCNDYYIPDEVHPVAPGRDNTITQFPKGKVGVYTRFPKKDDQGEATGELQSLLMPLVTPAVWWLYFVLAAAPEVSVPEVSAPAEVEPENVVSEDTYLDLTGSDEVVANAARSHVSSECPDTDFPDYSSAATVTSARRVGITPIIEFMPGLPAETSESTEKYYAQKDTNISLLDSRTTYLKFALDDSKAACVEAGSLITSLTSERDKLTSKFLPCTPSSRISKRMRKLSIEQAQGLG
ncbi:hypothetical protein Tco_1204275 [Tanacetum coccineum]